MEENSEQLSGKTKNMVTTIVVRFALLLIFLGATILIPAGTFNYWQAYVYFSFLVVPMAFVLFYFLKHDPQFLERRIKAKEKEKAQKIIQVVFTLFFIAAFVVSGLDHRNGWSSVPLYITLLANIVSLLGYIMVFFVFKQNSYASRIVEVESNQKVITTGLYSIVRHPMYVGVIVMWLPIPVALGSYWGLLPVATIPFALVLRILNEEKVLKRELAGYTQYCQKTKYRLVPFVW